MRRVLLALALSLGWLGTAHTGNLPLLGAGGGAGTPACALYTTFIAAVAAQGGNYPAAYQAFLCTSVAATGGTLAKCDAIWLHKAHEQATALTNVLAPASFAMTITGASISLTPDVGFTKGTAADSLDSHFNPTTAPTPHFVQNSATLFGYETVAASAGYEGIAGNVSSAGSQAYISLFHDGSQNFYRMNGAADITAPNAASGAGLFTATRTGANAEAVYQNGTKLGTDASASSPPANADIIFINDGYNSANLGTYAVSGVCSAFGDTDVSNMNTSLAAYLASVP